MWECIRKPGLECTGHPRNVMYRWNRTVKAVRRKQIQEPDLQDLIQFVEEEITLMNDLLQPREALHEYTKTFS